MFDFLRDDNFVSVISFADDLQMPRNNELAIRQNWSTNFCTARETQDQRESQKSNDSLTTSYTDRKRGPENDTPGRQGSQVTEPGFGLPAWRFPLHHGTSTQSWRWQVTQGQPVPQKQRLRNFVQSDMANPGSDKN